MPEQRRFRPFKYLMAMIIFPVSLLILYTIPAKLGMPMVTAEGFSTWQNALLGTATALALLLICLWLAKDKLKADWPQWKTHSIRNLLIAAGCAAFMFLALSPISKFLSGLFGGGANSASAAPFANALGVPLASALGVPLGLANILLSLSSLTAPFSEEIIFRYYLAEPFAKSKPLYGIAIVAASAFFALIHIFNVGMNVQYLLMYFIMALFLEAIYLLAKKNIWQNIMTHLLYNAFIVIIGLIGILTEMLM